MSASACFICISIHAPCEGSDPLEHRVVALTFGFQSTLPVKGATQEVFNDYEGFVFQSTLPVKGATMSTMLSILPLRISIHAPCEGSDSRPVCPQL